MQDSVTKPATFRRPDARRDTLVTRPRGLVPTSSNRAGPGPGRRSDRGQLVHELEHLVQTAILPRLLNSETLAAGRVKMPKAQTAARLVAVEMEPSATLTLVPRAGTDGEATGRRSDECAAALPDEVTQACVNDMVTALLSGDSSAAYTCVEALQDRGLVDSRIMLDVLTPAARKLGALWDDDRCDFLEVSIGLGRLEDIVARVSALRDSVQQVPHRQERCLLLPAPGETHLLGVAMVESFFAQAGWHCERGTVDNFAGRLRRETFDLVGFSLSCTRHLDGLRSAITQCRDVSKNPSLIVLVGGPVFLENPELGVELGADATAQDASSAVALAQSLLKQPCDV